MEPHMPVSRSSPEMGAVQQGGELPRPQVQGGETLPSRGPEYAPSQESHESQPRPSQGDPIAPLPVQPVVAPAASQAPSATSVDDVSTHLNPATANDDDVIEKAWVERAKKIVNETINNPYLQKQKVSELRVDYQLKRYGRDVKVPTD